MPTNVKEFNRQLKVFAETLLPGELVLFHKKIALDALSRIVLKTPVDVGRARGGWQIDIGKAPDEDIGRIDKSGGTVLSVEAKKLDQLIAFQMIVIGNNVEYIRVLEKGNSSQAPNGMVEITFAELGQMF